MEQPRLKSIGGDGLAIGVSLACLVHCVALPILIALMPAAARLIGLPDWLHVAAFIIAVPASAWAMQTGYRHHGRILPALLGALGLVFLGLGVLFGSSFATETGLTVCGSVLLIMAHLRNWQLRRRPHAPAWQYGERVDRQRNPESRSINQAAGS